MGRLQRKCAEVKDRPPVRWVNKVEEYMEKNMSGREDLNRTSEEGVLE